MSRYNDDFITIDAIHREKFPITYHHIYHFSKKKIKKDKAFFGLRVEAYNTSSFYASGPYKPTSKIIDLDVFSLKDGEAK